MADYEQISHFNLINVASRMGCNMRVQDWQDDVEYANTQNGACDTDILIAIDSCRVARLTISLPLTNGIKVPEASFEIIPSGHSPKPNVVGATDNSAADILIRRAIDERKELLGGGPVTNFIVPRIGLPDLAFEGFLVGSISSPISDSVNALEEERAIYRSTTGLWICSHQIVEAKEMVWNGYAEQMRSKASVVAWHGHCKAAKDLYRKTGFEKYALEYAELSKGWRKARTFKELMEELKKTVNEAATPIGLTELIALLQRPDRFSISELQDAERHTFDTLLELLKHAQRTESDTGINEDFFTAQSTLNDDRIE